MSIQQFHDLSEQAQIDHRKLNGGYNDYPPNWKELTAAEFAKTNQFTFDPIMVEFRQMLTRDAKGQTLNVPAQAAHLYWHHDGKGYAVVNDFWRGTIKFFEFGQNPPGWNPQYDSSD